MNTWTGRRLNGAFFVLAAVILASALFAQKFPWQDTPEAGSKTPPTVRFEGPDQIDVAARKPQVVELRFRIQDGFHINSHTPHEKNLIPTQLLVVDGDGVNVSAVDFPPGTDTSFATYCRVRCATRHAMRMRACRRARFRLR
jgi:hypothetical protein